jgi:L-cysteine:1D-myo-inositol 2-amino-2-deoxy-alpha-D-glucopyranoside ligase
MSKSLGNLVFVSDLTAAGVDPRAIRLAIFSQRYNEDWEWTDDLLAAARERLARWSAWAATGAGTGTDTSTDVAGAEVSGTQLAASTGLAAGLTATLRAVLSNDLDTPSALIAIDEAIAAGAGASASDVDAIDALLGIRLR